ncbi:MAG: thioredoxin domain-containing protein, partial [Candidatus Woesearchaeota archaeon]
DLTGKAMTLSPRVAQMFYNNYKFISWIVLVIFIWSFFTSTIGVYNYTQYGNCNGPESNEFCIFDPTGQNSGVSETEIDTHTELTSPGVQENRTNIGSPNAELTIIEFGCYSCPYTMKAQTVIDEVLAYYEGRVNLQYRTFVLPSHLNSLESGLAAACADEQGTFEAYHKRLFDMQTNATLTFTSIAQELNLDIPAFEQCLTEQRYKDLVDEDTLTAIYAGVEGTPTFFINDQVIVGPKPLKTFQTIIDEELQ